MLKIQLVAENKTVQPELTVAESVWRPARSLMAIANQKHLEKKGEPVVSWETMHDIDESIGCGLDGSACFLLASEMEELMGDPFSLVDYGMTVDIKDGDMVFTYPTEMATAYFKDVDSGEFIATLEEEGIVGKRVYSWFRAKQNEVQEIVDFMKNCGGFTMP
jgi:hypothetical protein